MGIVDVLGVADIVVAYMPNIISLICVGPYVSKMTSNTHEPTN